MYVFLAWFRVSLFSGLNRGEGSWSLHFSAKIAAKVFSCSSDANMYTAAASPWRDEPKSA